MTASDLLMANCRLIGLGWEKRFGSGAMTVCPACAAGRCQQCEGQGCYCECQIDDIMDRGKRAFDEDMEEYEANE